MGARNYKRVKGHEYLYYVTSDRGKKRVVYCGPVSNPDTEKRALELEAADLKNQKTVISKRLEVVMQRLKSK